MNYTNKCNYLKETFKIINNQPRTRRNDYEPFVNYEEIKESIWFLTYSDVKETLREYNKLLIKQNVTDEELKKFHDDINKQFRTRKKDWGIKYQKRIFRRICLDN